MGNLMNGLRTFLASLRFSGDRFDLYYGKVIAAGPGYPTADEARRDVAQVRQTQLNTQTVVR